LVRKRKRKAQLKKKNFKGEKLLKYIVKKWQRGLYTDSLWLRREAIGGCSKSDVILLIALNIKDTA